MNVPSSPRIAVVGSGITGLAAAWRLSGHHAVTLFEQAPQAGGHSHTVDITLEGVTHGVDMGFLVFNPQTYPGLVALFESLRVPTAPSDMSFSVQTPLSGGQRLEWAGNSLDAVFAQRRNLLRPAFLRMLRDLLRFNRQALADLASAGGPPTGTLGEYLQRGGYGDELARWYLLPMAASIWSCPIDAIRDYPIRSFLQFCRNHGLLNGLSNRPQWYTVAGGSREYVRRILAGLDDVRLGCPVLAVRRTPDGRPVVCTAAGTETFDAVVVATHSDTALQLLDNASADERRWLGALRYQPNHAILHTDRSVLPRHTRAWASWNYEAGQRDGREAVCCHYLINRLQPVPFQQPVIVSLNPLRPPSGVLAEFPCAHPVFDDAAVAAQGALQARQGEGGVWLAGAWCGYGFHEDGLQAGLGAAQSILAHWATPPRGGEAA